MIETVTLHKDILEVVVTLWGQQIIEIKPIDKPFGTKYACVVYIKDTIQKAIMDTSQVNSPNQNDDEMLIPHEVVVNVQVRHEFSVLGAAQFLGISLIAGKMAGLVDLSWYQVTAPLWAIIALGGIVALIQNAKG